MAKARLEFKKDETPTRDWWSWHVWDGRDDRLAESAGAAGTRGEAETNFLRAAEAMDEVAREMREREWEGKSRNG